MRRNRLIAIAVLAGVAALIAVRALHTNARVQVITIPITVGPIQRDILTTGTLQAATTVQVGTQLSGTIQSVYVDYNSLVHKGEVLARLDPASYQADLEHARAALTQAQADLENARATAEDAETKDCRRADHAGRSRGRGWPRGDARAVGVPLRSHRESLAVRERVAESGDRSDRSRPRQVDGAGRRAPPPERRARDGCVDRAVRIRRPGLLDPGSIA
jgi:hypothetical protein